MDKNFYTRLATGIVFVAVLVGCTIGNAWSFGVLFLLILTPGLWEFYSLAEKTGASPLKLYGTLTGMYLFITAFLFTTGIAHLPLLFFILLLFPVFIIELFRKKDNPFLNIAFTLLGVIYIALPLSLWCFVLLHPGAVHDENKTHDLLYNWHPLLGFFILVWTSDTMAYVCGKFLGKHKLFERVSPKKTWEGTIGGGLFALVAAWVLSKFFREINVADWIELGLIVVVFGGLGDLVKSLLKRSVNVKDSGTILPGHGGILDRFDAVLLASPFVVAYLLFLQHAVS